MSSLLLLSKDGCAPCSMVKNFLAGKNIEYKDVNAFESPEIAGKYDIASVPVLILLDEKGEEVKRSKGFNPPEIEEILKLMQ